MRISHWLLAACVAIAWLTRDARLADLHAAAGWCALLLVVLRVAWGFVGTKHARFRDFSYGLRDAWRYLVALSHGAPAHHTGHNPAGSWAVYLLLAGVFATCATGIAALASMFGAGPISITLAAVQANALREMHEWLAWALLAVIVAHVAGAIASSLLHRENLVAAMFTGRKTVHAGDCVDVPARRAVAVAWIGTAIGAGALYLFSSGWASGYSSARAQAKATSPAPTRWTRECGACHLAYPPSLLPQRSWQRMVREQSAHFGEDLSLSSAAAKALLDEAAASRPAPWAAWRLASSAPADESPQRITELRSWRRMHRDLPASAFKAPVSQGKHDCESCHLDAASGIFHPRMIQGPVRESIL